jgi:hypothetical protein
MHTAVQCMQRRCSSGRTDEIHTSCGSDVHVAMTHVDVHTYHVVTVRCVSRVVTREVSCVRALVSS